LIAANTKNRDLDVECDQRFGPTRIEAMARRPRIVATNYPLAQTLWPRKLRNLRSTFCAIQIELFPFKDPITSATEYFGPFLDPAFLALGELAE